MRERDWSLALVLAAVAAIWLLAASRWIVTDTVVPWDAKNQFYAFFRFLASTIHGGHAPFWNPYHYGGHPSVADPQSLIFSPPFVLWALFDPAPSIRAFDLIVYAHLAVGGLAVGALGWRAGWPLPASVLAAVIFMFGGPASGRLQHSGIIISYGLFPVVLLLIQMALHRRSVPIAGAFGIVAAVLALGRNHEALLLCFVLAAALAGEILSADDRRRYLRERAAVLPTMAIVSLVLVAVPLLLTVQFAALSNRPEVPLEKALEASLYPANLASLAVANVLGSLETTQVYWGPNHDTLPAVGATDRSFNYLFVGAASTIVVLWFGIAGGGVLRRANRVMAAVLLWRCSTRWAATRRSTLSHSRWCRASACSAGRSTARSCWSPHSRCLPASCSPTTCATASRASLPGGLSPLLRRHSASSPGPCCSRASPITDCRRSGRS